MTNPLSLDRFSLIAPLRRSLPGLALLALPVVAGCPPVEEEEEPTIEVAFDSDLVIVDIAAGEQHTVLLTEDGDVWATGNNTDGELGHPEDVGMLETLTLTPDVGEVLDIVAGDLQTFLIYEDGTADAFGWNGDGQLGIGSDADRQFGAAAVQTTGIASLSAGSGHTLAIDANGDALGWGNNLSGEVGDNSTDDRTTPVFLPVLEDVLSIDASRGGASSVASTEDGTLYTWGSNGQGQLGDAGDGTNALTPQVLDVEFAAVDVAAGQSHMLALDTDGNVWGWGTNDFGQLGTGAASPVERPVRTAEITDVVAIDAGNDWSIAIKDDGTVWVWGTGTSGQLGNDFDDNGPALVPQQVPLLEDIVQVTAGSYHAIALDADGNVFAWGLSDMGQLSLGVEEWRYSPVQIF